MKKVIPFVIVLIVVIIAAYGIWKGWFTKREEAPAKQEVLPAAVGGVPAIETPGNPLEKAPEINPVEKANPFKDIKTNPFE